MTSLRIVLAGLLVCTTSQAVFAELAAQPFLAPPRLVEKGAPGTLKATESTLAKTDCNPQGDITRDGQTVELNLQVQQRENYIYNPGNPDGAKDKVKLRSYGGCLSGPLIDVQPGNTLRVHLDNQLDKNDPSCPGGGSGEWPARLLQYDQSALSRDARFAVGQQRQRTVEHRSTDPIRI